ncbi:cupredoxin family copper-binding protein [Nocardia sp. NPDC051570]|uniref:cupredoxin family copper-binding protein n=1 Tax=Nocardia sp. NPDC051570 TaxID=3364324 RepID=UPI0037BB61B8
MTQISKALCACGVAAGIAVALTACGTHSATTADPTPVFAPGSPTPGFSGGSVMMPMPAMTEPPSTTTASAPVAGDAVSIENFAFAPATLSVRAGTAVTWTNKDEEPHTVADKNGGFHSPGLGTGAVYTFTFTKAGTYDYVCTIHPFMHGTVVVTP